MKDKFLLFILRSIPTCTLWREVDTTPNWLKNHPNYSNPMCHQVEYQFIFNWLLPKKYQFYSYHPWGIQMSIEKLEKLLNG